MTLVKNILLLILAFMLALSLSGGVIYLLWFEFNDFEWGYGFWEVLQSLFAAILWITSIVNILAYALCFAAWNGVLYMCKKVFVGNDSNKVHSYNRPKYYQGVSLNDFDDSYDSNYHDSYWSDNYIDCGD